MRTKRGSKEKRWFNNRMLRLWSWRSAGNYYAGVWHNGAGVADEHDRGWLCNVGIVISKKTLRWIG